MGINTAIYMQCILSQALSVNLLSFTTSIKIAKVTKIFKKNENINLV